MAVVENGTAPAKKKTTSRKTKKPTYTKEQYIELLEGLNSKKIDSFEFYLKFWERSDANGAVLDSLKANSLLLSPHEKSKKFSEFIHDIMDFCYSYEDIFESDEENSDWYNEFRDSMEKIYLKIRTFLGEE